MFLFFDSSSKYQPDTESYRKITAILETAWQLFSEKGFDHTSVNDIVESAGISKGAFYHYFTSKNEMLRALSEHHNRQRLEKLIPIFEDEKLSGIEKINKWLNAAQTWKVENFKTFIDVSRVIYNDENVQLRMSMADMRMRLFSPWIAKVIEQGVKEGTFDTAYPKETAEVFMWVSNGFGEISSKLLVALGQRPENRKLIDNYVEVFFSSLDSLLGAPDGSIERPDKKYTKMLYDVFSS